MKRRAPGLCVSAGTGGPPALPHPDPPFLASLVKGPLSPRPRLCCCCGALRPLAPGEKGWARSWEQESLSSRGGCREQGEATGPPALPACPLALLRESPLTGPQPSAMLTCRRPQAESHSTSLVGALETWSSAQHCPDRLAAQAQGISRKTDRPGPGIRLRRSLSSPSPLPFPAGEAQRLGSPGREGKSPTPSSHPARPTT